MKDEIKGYQVYPATQYPDNRGFFEELFSLKNHSLIIRQVSRSFSKKDVLRGIHVAEFNKLVTCVHGKVFDVVIDFRSGDPVWKSTILDGNQQVLIPSGCGHAFLALEDSEVIYAQDAGYEDQLHFAWDDPTINIQWPIDNPILSEKDSKAGKFIDFVDCVRFLTTPIEHLLEDYHAS